MPVGTPFVKLVAKLGATRKRAGKAACPGCHEKGLAESKAAVDRHCGRPVRKPQTKLDRLLQKARRS